MIILCCGLLALGALALAFLGAAIYADALDQANREARSAGENALWRVFDKDGTYIGPLDK